MKLYIITGTSGAGKSTIKDELDAVLDHGKYACVDSDEVSLNWWDYAGTDHESQYGNDTLNVAIRKTGGRDLVFVSCLTPQDYMTRTTVPEEVKATFFIALWASDETIYQRLRARPKERGFTSDEIIRPHIEYNRWIGRNRGKYQRNTWGRSFCVDNNGLGRYNQTGDGDGSYRKNHEQKQYLSYHATRNQPAADFS